MLDILIKNITEIYNYLNLISLFGHSIIEYFILLIIGFLVGFINVIAGGGSVFVLPFLIFLGLDHNTANGTNRIGIFMQTLAAVRTYKRDFYEEYPIGWKMSLLTIPGAITGTITAVNVSSEVFEMILALVMIFVMFTMVFNIKINNHDEELNTLPKIMYLIMFLVGFYGGFIQVGIGFILMFVVNKFLNKNLVKTNFHKSFIVMIYTIPSLIIFILNDNIDWLLGIVLGIGSAIGSYVSVKVSIKNGDKVIKPILIVSMLVIILKLFKLY